MTIERLPNETYLPTASDALYVDWLKLHPLFDRLAFVGGLLLQGPKGSGKSLAIAKWAAAKKYHIVTFDCSEDVRRAQLYGSFVLRGNETPFILGPIGTAIEIANETGACILNFEEINTLTPQMQKTLNPITDWRRALDIPEARASFRLKPDAKLWVTGSMNNTAHGGVYELNEDLKSRMRFIYCGYPDAKAERKVLDKHNESFGVDTKVLDAAITLASESRSETYGYPLSTRDLVQFLEDVKLCGLEAGLWLLLGKYEGANRETVRKRIESAFNAKPKNSL